MSNTGTVSSMLPVTLSESQTEEFITRGFTVVRGAFPRGESIDWVREECALAGYNLDDPGTWALDYVRLRTTRKERIETYAPVAWGAICALMGGAGRIRNRAAIDLMAVNLSQGADRPFVPPSPAAPGWHKDGWHFRHFLDSPEQGFLGIPLLTDVLPRGGATFIAAGSVGPVARFLAEHPEGVMPNDFPVRELLSSSGVEFLEATGEAGDFYLLHPYLLHATSQNALRRPRAICNVLIELTEPMRFDRTDNDYSPVEQAILRGLGVERFDFAPTRERYRTPDYGPIDPKLR